MPPWSIENEHRLLLTIINLLNISQLPKWDIVSKEMNDAGLPFTPEGCRQHFQKLRKSNNAVTPKKGAGKPSGVSKKATPAKRKFGQVNQNDEVDDDEDVSMSTPSKTSKGRDVEASKVLRRDVKLEQNAQTAHIFKTDKPNEDRVIIIDDDDNESIYDRE